MAITELQGPLGVLRDAAPDLEPAAPAAIGLSLGTRHAAPGVELIPTLIEQGRSAGLQIDDVVFSTPRAVSAGVSLSLFRVVQEALTNVLKHASAAAVDVGLRYRDASVEVEITDDGVGAAGRSGAAPGYGLAGLRERVAVHGGELVAGPRDTGGFRVRAHRGVEAPYRDNEQQTDRIEA